MIALEELRAILPAEELEQLALRYGSLPANRNRLRLRWRKRTGCF